jgi:hypothetical protein
MKMNKIALTMVVLAISSGSYTMSAYSSDARGSKQVKSHHAENRTDHGDGESKLQEHLGVNHKKLNRYEMRQLQKGQQGIASKNTEKLSEEAQQALEKEIMDLNKDAAGNKGQGQHRRSKGRKSLS